VRCRRCNGSGVEADWLAIGKDMRKLRERLGISLRATCRAVGVTAAYLSDMERGRRAWRGPKALKVAAYLKRKARP
jgi:transcriptional regulator with XRE-family HTH domain